jgi:hypothetical protein
VEKVFINSYKPEMSRVDFNMFDVKKTGIKDQEISRKIASIQITTS